MTIYDYMLLIYLVTDLHKIVANCMGRQDSIANYEYRHVSLYPNVRGKMKHVIKVFKTNFY